MSMWLSGAYKVAATARGQAAAAIKRGDAGIKGVLDDFDE